MIRLEPQLTVTRLVVLQGDNIAYDEKFHIGLNIIRGENASGKSSVADLLFFGLGGDVSNWRTEARMCTSTYVEVLLNGVPATLQRDIASEPRRSMAIYYGPYEAARISAIGDWQLFSYAQMGSKISFSNVLFTMLKIPEVRGSLASRMTMHQLLRIMYVDQVTPANQIFRFEQFDTDLVRDVVGSLLCGVYDSEFYDIEVSLRSMTSELDSLNGQIRSEERMLGEGITLSSITKQMDNAQQERAKLYEELKKHETTKWTAARLDAKQKREIDELERVLQEYNSNVVRLRSKREQLTMEIADSDLFLLSLKNHLDSLNDSIVLRETLGSTHFDLCPACYAHVQAPSSDTQCALCKSQLAGERRDVYIARLRNELAQQHAESALLQRKREAKLEQIESELSAAELKSKQSRLQYSNFALSTAPGPDVILSKINQRIGYLDSQLEELNRRLFLANSIAEFRKKAAELGQQIARLEEAKQFHETQRRERAFSAHTAVSKITLDLLEKDLDREEAFREAKNVHFDFARNVVLVDGQANFSASSMVYLKNAFHLALLIASTEMSFFRYPRFLLMDNIEDKGMEEARSHNFQTIIAAWSDAVKFEHQIIITTSMIDPKLNVPKYTVGDFYTSKKKTLRVKKTAG